MKLNREAVFSIIRISGKIFMFAITMDMYVIVLHAFIYGHSVNVHFNAFAEAYLEYVLFLLMFPIIILSIVLDVREFKKRKRQWKKEHLESY